MSKNIMILYPPNKRSVAFESVCEQLVNEGYNLYVVTLTESGELHQQLNELGVPNFIFSKRSSSSKINLIINIIRLIKFCKQYKIQTVWSHLQEANLIAVITQFFVNAKVVTFRHHFHAIIKVDGFRSVNKNEVLMEKIICKLAKEIVVPSMEVFRGMVDYEGVPEEKIAILPYIYNFARYPKADLSIVGKIKETYPCKLLIIVASRLVKMKRHILVFPIFKKLIDKGFDIKVLVTDDGEEKDVLQEYVKDNHLENFISFLGYKLNIIDYLSASDLLVHPSYTEASSSIVKEFGYLKKTVVVCDGVGDFGEYIINDENGFLVYPGNEAEQFEHFIEAIYLNPEKAKLMGLNLYHTVVSKFEAKKNIFGAYLEKV